MSDNFDRKVCIGLQSTKNSDNCLYDNIYTTIYTNINTVLTNYQASFCSVCKKVALAIKEKHANKTCSGQSV